jgi:alkylation response protein AidB-like acyl-CoA dehydrogenase
MNLDFSVEDNRFRQEVRGWLQDNVPRRPPPKDSRSLREFELDWQQCQYEGGWAGLSWPKEYGGCGLTPVQQLIWFEESYAADAPPIACLVIALNHGGPTLVHCATDAQKSFHLPKILKGEVVWCQGFSEPNAGSDLAAISTRAVIDGDHLVVSGQKVWTSYGDIADYQELLVRTDPSAARHKGISWVICDMKTPGIVIRPIRTMAGHEHFCEIFYDQVRIPLANVVGELNGGWLVAMTTLGFERGTGYIPHLIRIGRTLDDLVELAVSRRGAFPSALRADVDMRLAEIRAEIVGLQSMAYMIVSRGSGAPGPEGSVIALAYAELAQRLQQLALEIVGNAFLDKRSAVGGWSNSYLDSFRQTIAGGTSEIRRNIIAERVLGLPRGD